MSKTRTIPASNAAFQAPTSAADPSAAKPPEQPPEQAPQGDVAPKVRGPKPNDVPDAIQLTRDFGFRLNGVVRTWPAGQLITKRVDIIELLANGAPARRFREILDV